MAHLRQRVPSIGREEAEQIAAAVGDLPLAVATAGAWLADTSYTVSDYLEELERQPQRALTASKLADQPEPVAKAWDVSLNRLRDRSLAAARLFELCSVMAPEISLNLIYSAAMASVLEPLDPALSEKMVIGRIVQEINRLALIKLDSGAGQIVVHMLVQEVVRDRMSAEQLAAARRDVQRILVAARPRRDVDDPATWERYRLIWPHLPPSQAMTSDDEAVRQLYIEQVRYSWIRSDLERGRRLATEVEACWMAKEAAGTDQAATSVLRKQLLQLRYNLGIILRYQGRLTEARDLNMRVMEEQKLLLGEDHPHTLMTAGSLAADLRAIGHYREALKMDEKTHPAWTALYGEDHQGTLAAANNLATSLRLAGDIAGALRVDVDTYERRRAALGPKDIWTLSSARAIARDLLEAGEYGEASARMAEVHRDCAEMLGADSQGALDAQVLLGITMRSVGRQDEAQRPFHAALGMLTRRFGEGSSEVLACRLSNAANLLALERYAEAAQDTQLVLAEYERRRGPAHPHTLVGRNNLAIAQRFTGQHEESLRTNRQAVDGLVAALGDEHPYTLAAKMVTAVLLADQGQLEEAEEVEARTLEAMMRVLGPDHPDTLRCRANYMLTRQERGDRTAAAQRRAAIDQLAALLGDDYQDVEYLRQGQRLIRILDPQPF